MVWCEREKLLRLQSRGQKLPWALPPGTPPSAPTEDLRETLSWLCQGRGRGAMRMHPEPSLEEPFSPEEKTSPEELHPRYGRTFF